MTSTGRVLGAIVVIGGLYYLAQKLEPATDTDTASVDRQSVTSSVVKPNPAAVALLGVKIADFDWHAGGFGSIGLVTFKIQNDNAFAVYDLAVECNFSGESGTALGRAQGTIYKTFAAKKKTTVKEFNLGFINSQSERASCRITGLRL